MANEYEDLANKVFVRKETPHLQGESEYDSVATQTFEPNRESFDRSQFVAKRKNPDHVIEAARLAKTHNVPVDFVERNLEAFKEKTSQSSMGYEDIIEKSPRLAKWLEDPYKASVSNDDLDSLSKVERSAGRIMPYKEGPSYFDDLAGSVSTGYNQLETSGMLLGAAYGMVDIETVANSVAERNKKIRTRQEALPLYAKDFQEVMDREGQDIDVSFQKFKGSFAKIRDKKILDGLIDFGSGGAMTVAEIVDYIGEAVIRPKGFFRSSLESLAFSAPALVTGAAGAKGGALAGGAIGSLLPGAGTAGGAVVGGIGGFAAGTFAGSAATEVGAWIDQSLSERGFDTSNPDDLVRAFRNKKLMAEVRGEAERKGVTTAGVDALFSVVAGRFLKGAKGAGKIAAVKAGAKELGVQSIGEGASEFAGQAAARKGDLSKVSLGESVFEGVISMGHSVGEAVIGVSYRSTLSKKPTVAAVEVVEKVSKAQQTISELQALEQLGEIATESKLQTRDPEIFKEFFAEANLDGGADQAVYFQKEQWDEYWQSRGESPVQKAEELLGSSDSYDQADQSGQPVAIPLADYIAKMGDKPEFGELMQIVRTKPDGMTASEATQALQETPATMEELAQEAKAERERVERYEVAAQEIKKNLEEQLVAAGRDKIEAIPLAAFYQTMGVKEGINPLELAQRYGLNIRRVDESEAQSGETVFDQEQFEGSFKIDDDAGEFRYSLGENVKASLSRVDADYLETYDEKLAEYADEQGFQNSIIIESIEVNPDVQGAGLGSKAMSEIEAWAIAEGHDSIVLNASPQGAFTAFKDESRLPDLVRFYERQGFVAVNDEGSNVVMAKKLDSSFAQDQRGRIRISGNNKFTIELLKTADKSTFFHESGHYFLEVLKDMASMDQASQELKDDFKTILDWMGVESADQIKTEHHEKWARGFEAYLREGKAPSDKLRKAFNTFKVWLTSVYRSALQLDVETSDDIRGVMDRMFATQEEIDNAKNNMNDFPLFVDPIAAGMTESQAEKYRQAIGEAELSAKETALINAQKVVDRRKKIQESINKDRVFEAIRQEPIYQAIEQLRSKDPVDGAPPLKFDRAIFKKSFQELYGKPEFRGMFSDDGSGLSPDAVAIVLGFEDGIKMVEEINLTPPIKAAVDVEVQRLTDEQFALEESPETLAEQADIAIHNESRAKRLRLEYEHLSRGTQNEATRRIARRPAPDAEIKSTANKIINNIAISSIRPNQYRLAERRYAKEAGKLLAAKDIEGAFMAKQRELLNHYLYREAQDAKQFIRKGEKTSKRFFEKDEKLAKSRDMDLVGAARAVLARYGLGTSSKDALAQIQKIKEYNPDAYETVSSIVVGLVNNPDNYNNIEYGRFRDLMDGVNSLWSLSKDIKEVDIGNSKVSVAVASSELVAEMQKFKKKVNQEKYARTSSKHEKFKLNLLGTKARFRRFEHWIDVMDLGKIDGPFRKYLWTPVSQAVDEYTLKNKDFKKRFKEMSEEIAKTIEPGKKITAQEIGFEFKDKSELLGALLHTGNNSNFRKLIVGRNWGFLDEEGNLISGKWDKFIQRMWNEGVLTKADYDYVQSVWDLMEEIKPLANKAHKKMYGYYFDEITAKQIKTPFGDYRGGYAPAKVDPTDPSVQGLVGKSEFEEFVKGHSSFNWPASGGKEFTKSRVENFNMPLNLNMSLVSRHISDSLRFAIVKPAVTDAAKIITNQEFKSSMNEVDSKVIEGMIKPALSRADKDLLNHNDPSDDPLVMSLLNGLKTNAAMQIMFFNVTNTVEQLGGFGISATRIKPSYLAKSMVRFIKSPKNVSKNIYEKSQFMRARSDNQIFEIERQAKDVFDFAETFLERAAEKTGQKKISDWAKKHAYFTQAYTQNFVDNITWQAGYDEAISTGKTEEQAVKKADADVRITQSSRRPIDISNFETNKWLGFFNMFYNFFNMMANVNASNFTKLYYEDLGLREKSVKGLYLYMMGYAAIAITSEAVKKAAAGGLDEDDDDEYADDLYDVFVDSQIRLGFAMIPVLGATLNAGYSELVGGKPYETKLSASPAMSVLAGALRTSAKATKADIDFDKKSDVRDSLSAMGLILGIPLAPLAKPINYINDVNSGKARPTGPLDALRGVVTGKPGVQ